MKAKTKNGTLYLVPETKLIASNVEERRDYFAAQIMKTSDVKEIVMDESENKENLILKHNQDHARMAIEDIRLYETFDLARVRDGRFQAGVPAYNGELVVRVTVRNHRITEVQVVRHVEKQFFSSLTEMPAKMVRAQDFRDVDATTGATVTAEAIKSATARALAQGRGGS